MLLFVEFGEFELASCGLTLPATFVLGEEATVWELDEGLVEGEKVLGIEAEEVRSRELGSGRTEFAKVE